MESTLGLGKAQRFSVAASAMERLDGIHLGALERLIVFRLRLRRWRGWMESTLGLGKTQRFSVAGLCDGDEL